MHTLCNYCIAGIFREILFYIAVFCKFVRLIFIPHGCNIDCGYYLNGISCAKYPSLASVERKFSCTKIPAIRYRVLLIGSVRVWMVKIVYAISTLIFTIK